MIAILHEFYVQIITVIFMTAVIIGGIALGHAVKKAVNRKKQSKATEVAEKSAK